MRQTERNLHTKGISRIPTLFILSALSVLFLAGCATRPETASPDYANYLMAVDAIASYEAGVDRTILHLTVGAEPVILPPGTQMIVRQQPPALPVPEMWRDHAYEAELAYYGTIWSIVGGAAIPAMSGAYSSYNSRKMISDIMRYSGGATFQATESSQINFSGGWGDRDWGYQGGSFSEALDTSDNTTPSQVVNPIIVTP